MFKKSCSKVLHLQEAQIYQPYFSLYFSIHNTKNSHKMIDLKRRFYLKEIIEITDEKYHTSNMFLKGDIYDSHKSISLQKEIFCKCITLLDPLNYIMNNYNIFV